MTTDNHNVLKDPNAAVEEARQREIDRITSSGTVRAAGVEVASVDESHLDGTSLPKRPYETWEFNPNAPQTVDAWRNLGYPE